MFNVLFLALVLWGIAVRVILLRAPIDYDEAYSFLYYMRQDFFTVIGQYNLPNNHLLNSFLGYLVRSFFSPTPIALRALPLIFGVLCLRVLFLGLQVFFDRRVAMLATLVAWCSYPFIAYSALARGYIFMSFFFFLGLHFIHRKKDLRASVAWALAAWSLPTAIYAMAWAALTLKLLNREPARRILRIGVWTGGWTFLLYLPVFAYVATAGTKFFPVREAPSWEFYSTQFLKTFSFLWLPGLWGFVYFLPLLLLLKQKSSNERKMLGILTAFLVLVGVVNRSSIGYERLWIWLVPLGGGLLAAAALPYVRKVWVLAALLTLPLVVVNTTRISGFKDENDVKSLYFDMKETLRDGDFFLISQSTITTYHYWESVDRDKKIQDFQPFFMGGDWIYSLYRTRGPEAVLREKVGPSRFWAILEHPEDLARARALVQNFTGVANEARIKKFPHFIGADLAEIIPDTKSISQNY